MQRLVWVDVRVLNRYALPRPRCVEFHGAVRPQNRSQELVCEDPPVRSEVNVPRRVGFDTADEVPVRCRVYRFSEFLRDYSRRLPRFLREPQTYGAREVAEIGVRGAKKLDLLELVALVLRRQEQRVPRLRFELPELQWVASAWR